ncbi:hypothetical protein [Shinella sp.]|uniref:hypothetical protein n=1 Tax=Shinella sp. TaxID=1870904 RepID=UPI00289B0CA8|nr:hypothetical protein [Shinella sp.]
MAVYLGIPNVFILGLDGARASFPASHAWGNEAVSGPPDTLLYRLHQAVENLAKKEGASVWNASFGGVVHAIQKQSLNKIAPQLVKTNFDGALSGRIVLFKGNFLRIVPSVLGDGSWRVFDEEKARYLRHRGNLIILDGNADAGEHPDAHFHIEPSFVRSDWACFRSVNTDDAYITANNSFSAYTLRSPCDVFSPYFSSFQLYRSKEEAAPRMEYDRMLASIDQQTKSIGNLMMAHDRNS